jgi:hypothetical protein
MGLSLKLFGLSSSSTEAPADWIFFFAVFKPKTRATEKIVREQKAIRPEAPQKKTFPCSPPGYEPYPRPRMHATQTDHNITPQKNWKKEKNDTNSPTHKTQWRVHTELELNKHSRLNLANEKPFEKENRKIKTINEEESKEETNCWVARTTTTMEKQSGTTSKQTSVLLVAAPQCTWRRRRIRTKNDERQTTATRNNNTTNERTNEGP